MTWRRVTWANLIAQIGIVVTGGLVRLTGSGLGCPTWPQCVPGSFTPVPHQAQGFHKDIEFGNRLLTFAVTATALAVLVIAIRRHAQGVAPQPFWLAVVPAGGVVLQALVGGLTVLTGLSPLIVAAHFVISMALVAASAWLVFAEPAHPQTSEGTGPLRRLGIGAAAALVLVIGLGTLVTASGPNAGDEKTPRLGWDPQLASEWHGLAVAGFLALAVGLLVAARRRQLPWLERRISWLLGVGLSQSGIGIVQYGTGLPTLVVAAHLLGAALLVAAMTAVVTALPRPAAVIVSGWGAPAEQRENDQRENSDNGTNGSTATATKSTVK